MNRRAILLIAIFIFISVDTVAFFVMIQPKKSNYQPLAIRPENSNNNVKPGRQNLPPNINLNGPLVNNNALPENINIINSNSNIQNFNNQAGNPSLLSGIDDPDFCSRFNNPNPTNVNRPLPANINASGLRPSGMGQMQEKIAEICADGLVTDQEKQELQDLPAQNGGMPGFPGGNSNTNS